MSDLTPSAFQCTSLDPTASHMFTAGKTYPVHKPGFAPGTGYIIDDLRRERFICTSHFFVVENNSDHTKIDCSCAYFEPIFAPAS